MTKRKLLYILGGFGLIAGAVVLSYVLFFRTNSDQQPAAWTRPVSVEDAVKSNIDTATDPEIKADLLLVTAAQKQITEDYAGAEADIRQSYSVKPNVNLFLNLAYIYVVSDNAEKLALLPAEIDTHYETYPDEEHLRSEIDEELELIKASGTSTEPVDGEDG